jgi:hypothetical protein
MPIKNSLHIILPDKQDNLSNHVATVKPSARNKFTRGGEEIFLNS